MKKYFGVSAALISAVILSGCVAYGEAYVPAPPSAEVEVIGVAPGPGYIWAPGYWQWHRGHHEYRWHGGHWRRH